MKTALSALCVVGFVAAAGQAAAHTEQHGKTQSAKPGAPAPGVEKTRFGRAGDPLKVTRTIPISMSDQMRYEPAEIRVKVGETVKFVVANKGRILHEIVLGSMADLKEHAAAMKKFPEMEHEEPNQAHVKPGGKQDLVWHFDKPGEFYYACLIPGHFEAGMVGKVVVAPR